MIGVPSSPVQVSSDKGYGLVEGMLATDGCCLGADG